MNEERFSNYVFLDTRGSVDWAYGAAGSIESRLAEHKSTRDIFLDFDANVRGDLIGMMYGIIRDIRDKYETAIKQQFSQHDGKSHLAAETCNVANTTNAADPGTVDDLADRLRAWLRSADHEQTISAAAQALGASPLAIAEAVGYGHRLYMNGDTSSPDTAMVGEDGE